MKKLFFIFFVCVSAVLFSQSRMDSLVAAFRLATSDTVKCNLIFGIIEEADVDTQWPHYNELMRAICQKNLKTVTKGSSLERFYLKRYSDYLTNIGYLHRERGQPEKAIPFLEDAISIKKNINDLKGLSGAYMDLAECFNDTEETAMAINTYEKVIEIRTALKDKDGLAYALAVTGEMYRKVSNTSTALDYFLKSYKLREERNNQKGMALSLDDIGGVYADLEDYDKALDYYMKALKIVETLNDHDLISGIYNSAGIVYFRKNEITKALEYYEKARVMMEELGDDDGLGATFNNIGLICANKNEHAKALDNFRKALEKYEYIGSNDGAAITLNHMAGVYTRLNQLAEAEKCGVQSLTIGRKLGFPATIMLASKSLSTIYEKKGDWKNAFEMHALYREMSDSVSNDENREAGIKAQLKYDYDKKAAADSINFAKENEIRDLAIARQESELNTKRYQVYFTIGGLILVIVFAFFIIKRFRITRQQKAIIEHQKKVVEVKQKEILDSIYYAQRIQRSLLTSEMYIQRSIDLLKIKRE